MMMVVFDLDGTVTAEESLPRAARLLGMDGELERLTREAVAGRVAFGENLLGRVAMLGRWPVARVAQLVAETPLRGEIAGFIAERRERCMVATSNLDCWCSGIGKRLGCRMVCSHGEAAPDGSLAMGSVRLLDKMAVVDGLRKGGHRVVMVGDGANDVEAMRRADVAVALGEDVPREVAGCADFRATTAAELVELLRGWF